MEIVNVVIDEASESCFENISEEIPKEILPPKPKDIQEPVVQELASPSSPSTPSVAEGLADRFASLDSESRKEKGPSSRIPLNHPLENIVEPTKVEEALQDESCVEAMLDELP